MCLSRMILVIASFFTFSMALLTVYLSAWCISTFSLLLVFIFSLYDNIRLYTLTNCFYVESSHSQSVTISFRITCYLFHYITVGLCCPYLFFQYLCICNIFLIPHHPACLHHSRAILCHDNYRILRYVLLVQF